ncbi:MAG: T9SS type A sorting domain-containing protein, partial [Ignavibacteria bacterium]|nr:T9SS type A sorting domain-containing protein [Ignavibacteria bacterium]
YPNPFNGTTKFRYALSNKSKITIRLFNVLGETVATLLDSEMVPGAYFLTVNAASLPSGIYFYQLRAGDFTQTKKMILLR